MGFGDYIMLTALAANASKNNKKISFYYLTSKKRKVQKKNYARIELLYNNPDVGEILIESRTKFLLRRIWRFIRREKGYVYFPLRRFTQAYMTPLPDKKYHFELRNKHLHAVEAFCDMIDIKAHSVKPKVLLSEEEKNKVDSILLENNIAPKTYMIIETSTLLENSTKQWPLDHWQNILKNIKDNYSDLKIVQISPRQKYFDGVTDISGSTSFRESLRFVEQAAAVVTTEGALMHSAAVYDTPCLVIVSSCMSPNLSAYEGQKRLFYDKDLDCRECGILAECPKDNICMDGISPERVFESLSVMLDELFEKV